MILESRRNDCTRGGTAGKSRFFEENDVSSEITFLNNKAGETLLYAKFVKVSDDVKIKGMHRDLKLALIEYHFKNLGQCAR